MSNKPAQRCPGCGKEMVMRWQSYYGGIASMWYVCDCGWRSQNDKAVQRYKPIYDGYHGEQTQPVKIWHAAGGGRTI